jgi:LPS export ABC transporter protein LptC
MVGMVLALFVGTQLQEVERLQPTFMDESTGNSASVTLTDFDYRDVKEGRTRWALRAAEAQYFSDKQETILNQVNATFYLKDGREVRLQGDQGVFYNHTKNIEVRGNIRLSSAEGYSLKTDLLVYNRAQQLIYTDAPVRIEGEGLTLTGLGMKFEIDKRSLSILENIETELKGIMAFRREGQRLL